VRLTELIVPMAKAFDRVGTSPTERELSYVLKYTVFEADSPDGAEGGPEEDDPSK
jgi:hypothetical protein